MSANTTAKKQACTKRLYEVRLKDLPLSCPMPDMRLWDAHPRIYLPIAEEKRVVCPYCEAEYVLIEDKVSVMDNEMDE